MGHHPIGISSVLSKTNYEVSWVVATMDNTAPDQDDDAKNSRHRPYAE